ncbi:DUF4394 domain-containing protein [Streptomyces sp. NPDC051704]|uniref:DUF4394 domain-containing protein n=1 Tax=Streptomyces sp. NPDC051704 TaxID=3365671 RepID=UPI0037969C05
MNAPQAPGTLAPTGNLGANAGSDAGFDMYFSPRRGINHGFAALNTGSTLRLYGINLLTGAACDLGVFGEDRQVTDLALPLNQG